jgi:hypothetical protein
MYPIGIITYRGSVGTDPLRAEDLVKSDLVGKSDPYVVLTFGKQSGKSKTVANSQVGTSGPSSHNLKGEDMIL